MSLQDFQRMVDQDEWDREFVAWMEMMRDLDALTAMDPEPHARADFAAWVSQQGGAA